MRYAIIVLLACTSFAQNLPDAPSESKKKVADSQFWTLTALTGSANLTDAITTAALVGHTDSCRYESGTPLLYGKKATMPECSR